MVRPRARPDWPRSVVALGKCAARLLEGVAYAEGANPVLQIDRAFVAIPDGYREPQIRTIRDLQVVRGGHPQMTRASFEAGRALMQFVDRSDDVLFLISGGGSACVEWPLPPFLESDLATTNAKLLAAGLPIGEINVVRKQLSAIKGGRLAARVRGRKVTLIYSDVATGAWADVASGPTVTDTSTTAEAIASLERIGGCERVVAILRSESFPPKASAVMGEVEVIADNRSLTSAAAAIGESCGYSVVTIEEQLEGDVEIVAADLVRRAARLRRGELLVAGGEATVVQHGEGRGGRCSELALRFARAARDPELTALFGSSDGLDGSSGAAGIYLPSLPQSLDLPEVEDALARSDSFPLAASLGEPIIIPPTGNNLRDLILVTRGQP